MNYIRQLSGVFEKIDADSQVTPYHISLYLALFRRWNLNFFRNPISVSRDELMRLSKIGSVNTYTKCLKELDRLGFIKYEPSFNRHRGSVIYLYTFDKGSEQDVRPYINNINKESKINHDMYFNDCDSSLNDTDTMENQKSSSLKQLEGYGPDIPPSEEHVKIYFDEKGYPSVEAEKFFNYFQSNGWLVGGRSKMRDWKAAARNWILNAQKFNNHGKHQLNHPQNPKPRNLHARTNKDYSEPL